MLDEPKYWVSLITGIIAVTLGGLPLLNRLGVLNWSLPISLGANILLWIIAVFGAYLLIDSFLSEDDALMWTSAIMSLVIFGIAMVQILHKFEIIGFGVPESILSLTVLHALFALEGIGLVIAAFGTK